LEQPDAEESYESGAMNQQKPQKEELFDEDDNDYDDDDDPTMKYKKLDHHQRYQ
jgi:hypothetical protein